MAPQNTPRPDIDLEKTYEAQAWADMRLFQKRVKIFPKRVRGKFRTIKWVWLWTLLGIYYITPWIRWDRGPGVPDQAALFDIMNRKFYFFWLEIWPQDIFLLTGVLFLCAIGLFFVTSMFGRLWCAWGCPQTVWTDLFMIVERRIEGDRNARIKLDKSPWTFEKIWKRGLKHFTWILIAMATGGAWVFYFNDAPTLVTALAHGETPMPGTLWIGILTFTTYLMAGHAREQVCVYMCPYSRFQSVMLDPESLIVTYRSERGEPRGKHKKGDSWKSRGDCVDCTQCISVCPTGIDIRDGIQIACINCGLCADACDKVMDMVGRPKGLIALDSQANVERRARGEPSKLKIFRPRTFVYMGVIAAAAGTFIYAMLTLDKIDLNVLPERKPAYVLLSDGEIRNTYTVHIINKYHEQKAYTLSVEGLGNGTYWRQNGTPGTQAIVLDLAPDQVGSFRIFVAIDPGELDGASRPLHFTLTDPANGETVRKETVFIGPAKD